MTPSFTVQVLEAKHWDLVQKRMNALAKVCEAADKRQWHAIIERFNADPYWEKQFDDIAAQIRELDPNHSFLPENNPK